MSDIQFQPLWGDPPTGGRGAAGKNKQIDLALEAFVALMRTAPGRWAELSSVDEDGGHPAGRASMIKKRFPDVEVSTRSVPNAKNRRRIWVRVRVDVPDVVAQNANLQEVMRDRAAANSD